MLRAPYTPGSGDVPVVIAGRDPALAAIRERLGSTASFGSWSGAPLVYCGPRGLGKTVLLRLARRDAERAGFVTAWATGEPDDHLLRALVRSMSTSVSAGTGADERWQAMRGRLQAVSVEVGLPGAKVGAEFDVSPQGAGLDRVTFHELVRDTAAAARADGGAGVALFVDELQESPRNQLRGLAYAAQDLAGDVAPVVIVVAGLPSLPDRLTDAASFAERFVFDDLGPLDVSSARLALVEPARALGVRWTRSAEAAVLEAAQGYPYLVQLFGGAAWEKAAPTGAEAVISVSNARAGITQGLAQLERGMFRARWAKATSAERQVMSALAELGDGPVPRRAVAAALGRASGDLGMARASLIDKGILIAPSRGQLQFTVAGFAGFVRKTVAKASTG